jgi:hypothetical protein
MSITTIRNNLNRIASRSDGNDNTEEKNQIRQVFVDQAMKSGGKGFVERVKRYGATERGEKLRLTAGYIEQLELTGDFRVPWVLTTGSAQIGKAQPLDAKVLTPIGWVPMGELFVGGLVITPSGDVARINGVYPQGERDIYRVTTNDGGSTRCCLEHLWLTQTATDRARNRTRKVPLDSLQYGTVKTLAQIKDTLYKTDKQGELKLKAGLPIPNHSIPTVRKGLSRNSGTRLIKEIEYVGKYPAQCISIDHPAHLYITDDYIVTHNTLAHLLLQIDGVVCGKLNGAWFYATGKALDQMVPIQFRPAIQHWLKNMMAAGYKIQRKGDTMVNTRYQVDGATAIFTFVSTTNSTDDGMAAVGGVAASFTADYSIMEERSQYDRGSADICLDRMNNSKIETHPRRDLGTPGGGMGIEIDMQDCHHYFKLHYDCPHCQQTLPLTPKGCLLKEFEREDVLGNKIKTYLSESGRPEDSQWWCKDPLDPVNTAYVACSSCGGELSMDVRLHSTYRCVKSGLRLREFLDSLHAGVPDTRWKVGLHMSPLAQHNATVAQSIISNGLGTDNPPNWQQQGLGYPTSSETLTISEAQIRSLVGLRTPDGEADYRLAGIDVGRGEDWLVITDFYLPPDRARLSIGQIIEKTVRVIIYNEPIVRSDLGDILERYDVDYGLIDNEPSRDSAMKICDDTVLELGNQANPKDSFKQTTVKDGGVEYPCWDLRNSKFMLQVFESFYYKAWDGLPCYRLPAAWVKWYSNPTGRSPIRHLTGPWRDNEMEWHRAKEGLDDYYMAILFSEAAFSIKLEDDFKGVETRFSRYSRNG